HEPQTGRRRTAHADVRRSEPGSGQPSDRTAQQPRQRCAEDSEAVPDRTQPDAQPCRGDQVPAGGEEQPQPRGDVSGHLLGTVEFERVYSGALRFWSVVSGQLLKTTPLRYLTTDH